jgi:hypothetical protein
MTADFADSEVIDVTRNESDGSIVRHGVDRRSDSLENCKNSRKILLSLPYHCSDEQIRKFVTAKPWQSLAAMDQKMIS